MITFHNTKHLIEVMDFATKVGAMDKLLDKLRYLAEYGNGTVDNICELHNDWAPHSFEFTHNRVENKHIQYLTSYTDSS